jgi:23S rRNA (guanine745-N1)-methyltransferase
MKCSSERKGKRVDASGPGRPALRVRLRGVTLLACTVRGCGRPLERQARVLACAAGHTFDIARRGYVNLLQPQDRRSRSAGDSADALDARSALLDAGIGRAALDAIVERTRSLPLEEPVIVDLGSGSGELLAALAASRPSVAIGIDLSAAAAERAARRFPDLTWVVANADRRLPIVDGGADLVVSLHARRNPSESARILRPSGHLIVAVPAADDLIELRALVGGSALPRERGDAVHAEHAPFFTLVDTTLVRVRHDLTRAQLLSALRGTYRGARRSAAPRLESLEAGSVTMATVVRVYRPSRS